MLPRLSRRSRVLLVLAAATLLAAAAIVLIASPSWAALPVWLLTIALPGVLLGAILLRDDDDSTPLERALFSLGLGYGLALLTTLLLHYISGSLPRRYALTVFSALPLLLALIAWAGGEPNRAARSPAEKRPARGVTVLLALLLLLGAGLRLIHLGYSEFQGDEVAVMQKAAAAIDGRDDALFLHKKGPAEILLPLSGYALTGRSNEFAARLPFSLASLVGLAALYALARRWFGERSALWGALFWALCGFAVAFGRIVQYQSLVLMFGALTLLALTRRRCLPSRTLAAVAGAFAALGLWAHSDAVFVLLPALLWLLWSVRGERPLARLWYAVWPGLLSGGLLLALFYLPFALHPHFSATVAYLQSRGGAQPPYNNLAAAFDLFTVYHAVYYLAALILLPLIALGRVKGRARGAVWTLAAAALLAWLAATLLLTGRAQATALALGSLLLLLALGLARESAPWRIAVAWMGLPLLLYLFGFRDPRTHLYVLFPALCLLAGAELAALLDRPWRKRWIVLAPTAALLLLSGVYLAVIYLDHSPEYKRSYPRHRLALFWTPYGEAMPEQGLFGFPYRVGWKVIGALYHDGVLRGDLGSNEEAHIVRWYTRGVAANSSQPHYYVIARDVQDEQPVSPEELANHYELVGLVGDAEAPDLQLYERAPAQLPFTQYNLADWAAAFDADMSGPRYDQGLPPGDPPWGVAVPAELWLGRGYQFLGHTLASDTARAGDVVVLTLYWRALAPADGVYTVFTHVEDPGVVWGQKDRPLTALFDEDASYPQVVACQYMLRLADDAPAGDHALVAGVYSAADGSRLTIRDAAGNDLGTTLDLGRITIED